MLLLLLKANGQCHNVNRVLTILNDLGIDYETLNLLDEDHNPSVREAIKKYSEWPMIPHVNPFKQCRSYLDIFEVS